MRCLIIEDDTSAADFLKKGLGGFGYDADVAHDGDEGLSMARDQDYDLWLIDVMLPKRDGLSVLKSLRDDGKHVPALILSARGQVDDRVVDVHIGRIRKKVEDDATNPLLIATARGAGYRFEDEPV